RHLTPSQRAMIAGAIANLEHGGDRKSKSDQAANLPLETPVTQAAAATRFQVSERMVRDAKRVIERAEPEVVAAVKRGQLAVDAAAKLATLPAAEQRKQLERASKKNGGEIKSGKIRSLVHQAEKRAVVQKINAEQVVPLAAIGTGYRLIVVDPP